MFYKFDILSEMSSINLSSATKDMSQCLSSTFSVAELLKYKTFNLAENRIMGLQRIFSFFKRQNGLWSSIKSRPLNDADKNSAIFKKKWKIGVSFPKWT